VRGQIIGKHSELDRLQLLWAAFLNGPVLGCATHQKMDRWPVKFVWAMEVRNKPISSGSFGRAEIPLSKKNENI
jgi:hypothetical protein